MSTTAYIAGPLGLAALHDGEAVGLLDTSGDRRSARSMDWTALRLPGVEIEAVEVASVDDLPALIQTRQDVHDALTHTLIGLDAVVSDETAALNIEVAEELLADDDARAFVRNRLFSRLAPDALDLDRGLDLARQQGAVTVAGFYEALWTHQPAIRTVLTAWTETAPTYLQDLDELDRARRTLIDAGVFADFVEAVAAREFGRLDSLIVAYGMTRELTALVPRLVHLLTDLRNREWEAFDYQHADVPNPTHADALTEPPDPVLELLNQIVEKNLSATARRYRRRTLSAQESMDRIDSQIERITILLEEGRGREADRALVGLLEFHAQHSERQQAAKSLSRLVYAAKTYQDFERADLWSTYSKTLNSSDPVVWSTHAEVLKAVGRLDDALTAYDEAARRFPNDEVAATGRAEVLKVMGRLDDALTAYDEATARFSDNAFVRNGRAEVLKAMGRYGRSLAAYQDAARRFPSNAVALNGRAEVLRSMGRLDDALAAYDEAKARFPDDAYTWTGRAEVLRSMGRLDDALAAYDEAANRFPGDEFTRNGHAALLVTMGRYRQAIDMLPSGQPRYSQDWIAQHIRAMALLKLGKTPDAVRLLEDGLKHSPWQEQRRYFASALGVARLMEHQYQQALDLLTEAETKEAGTTQQTHALLVAHAQAGLDLIDEAKTTLHSLPELPEPGLIVWRDALKLRYRLNGRPAPPSPQEVAALDQAIEEQEIRYAMSF